MKNFLKNMKNERGLAIVEATILFPVCIIIVVAIYYAALFLCQKANLQANLQNTLVYFKNVESDTYVSANKGMTYQREKRSETSEKDSDSSGKDAKSDKSKEDSSVGGNQISGSGSGYEVNEPLFPYRFFTMKFTGEDEFSEFFRSMCGYMFFDTGENVEITAETTNYVVYKEIYGTAKQEVKPAISLSLIGLPDTFHIAAYGKVVSTDPDDFIRNVDFITDMLSSTKLGGLADGIVDKISSVYDTFKNMFD